MRNTLKTWVAATIVSANLLFAAPEVIAAPVRFACSGPKVDPARKVAKDNELKLGMDPKACFGEMRLTESARKETVVAVASEKCKAGKLAPAACHQNSGRVTTSE